MSSELSANLESNAPSGTYKLLFEIHNKYKDKKYPESAFISNHWEGFSISTRHDVVCQEKIGCSCIDLMVVQPILRDGSKQWRSYIAHVTDDDSLIDVHSYIYDWELGPLGQALEVEELSPRISSVIGPMLSFLQLRREYQKKDAVLDLFQLVLLGRERYTKYARKKAEQYITQEEN